jgi:hypothetical protein
MSRSPRRRRAVSPGLLVAAKPFFRHSYSRDAYVLRVVGNKMGPVLVPASSDAKHGAGFSH